MLKQRAIPSASGRKLSLATVLTLVVLVTVTVTATTVAAQTTTAPDCSAVTYDGSGTESTPYKVSNVSQLQCIRDKGPDRNYALVSDIDASGTSEWNNGKGFKPVGNLLEDNTFNGSFNGNGHSITGLTIDRESTSAVGMFKIVGDSTTLGRIENVTLINPNVTARSLAGAVAAQVLAGSVEDVHVVSTADSSSGVEASSSVGGLVGDLDEDGAVNNSSASVDINGSGSGGLVGSSTGSITDSYATGDVIGGSSGSKLGGLVGTSGGRGKIVDSYSTGDVKSGSDFIGGLVGQNSDFSVIVDSYATGDVEGKDRVGGLVGKNNRIVRRSYATGDVDSVEGRVGGLVGISEDGAIINSSASGDVNGSSTVGGLVGYNFNSSKLDDVIPEVVESHAKGNVTGSSTVGGVVGLNGGNMNETYAAGNISGDDNVGGLVGQNGEDNTTLESDGSNGTLGDSYWDVQASGQNEAIGQEGGDSIDGEAGKSILRGEIKGLPTANMTGDDAPGNMTTFDFGGTWKTVTGPDDYPFLVWRNVPPTVSLTVTPQNPDPGTKVTFDGSGSADSDGAKLSYEWRVDGEVVGSGSTLDYTFPTGGSYNLTLVVTDSEGAKVTEVTTVLVGAFTQPLPGFNNIPANTGELDPTLYEDLDGNGDGTDVSQTISLFSKLVRGDDLGLTDEQAKKLNWGRDPQNEVTPGDMVALFGKQIRAG